MVDTQRSLADIISLFADNSTGAISPQDVRDQVETLRLSYGEIYVSTPGATSITDTTSYFDVNGTYTLGLTGVRFDMATNGQLRYTGVAPVEGIVLCTMSFTVAGTNDIVHLRLAKNGTSLPATEVQRKVSTGSDVGAIMAIGLVNLTTNDYVTAEVRNETATDNVTAENLTLLVAGFAV
jgi:hypothetical protein